MDDTREFADAIGRKKMAEALSVLPTAVSNAVGRPTFPATWLNTCKALADSAGIECPPKLFAQRPFHNPPIVNGKPNIQGEVGETLPLRQV